MKLRKIPAFTFWLGIVLLIISMVVPYNAFEFILGEGIRPVGLVTIIINPTLGAIGAVLSIATKRWGYLILNIVLFFNFFIIMTIGYALLGA